MPLGTTEAAAVQAMLALKRGHRTLRAHPGSACVPRGDDRQGTIAGPARGEDSAYCARVYSATVDVVVWYAAMYMGRR